MHGVTLAVVIVLAFIAGTIVGWAGACMCVAARNGDEGRP